MVYQIWMEGYRATGEEQTASFLGTEEGGDFPEAVRLCISKKPEPYWLQHLNTKVDPPQWWGCRLFDNETDARKSFG